MSRELERRLARIEAKHHADTSADKRIGRMTDAELTAAINKCRAELEAEHGEHWRDWLAEHEPDTHRALRQLEMEGAL